VNRARVANLPIVAIVLDLPPDVVLARNASRRGRIVDEAVVRMHLADVERAAGPGRLEAEGFDLVVRLRSAEDAESLTILRKPAASPTPPR
jgi:predicted kinase